jgi:hypothetical protein
MNIVVYLVLPATTATYYTQSMGVDEVCSVSGARGRYLSSGRCVFPGHGCRVKLKQIVQIALAISAAKYKYL